MLPISARADLVIWQRSLPHTGSINIGTAPRVVQYITMNPANAAQDEVSEHPIRSSSFLFCLGPVWFALTRNIRNRLRRRAGQAGSSSGMSTAQTPATQRSRHSSLRSGGASRDWSPGQVLSRRKASQGSLPTGVRLVLRACSFSSVAAAAVCIVRRVATLAFIKASF